jgi:hypothetical protein
LRLAREGEAPVLKEQRLHVDASVMGAKPGDPEVVAHIESIWTRAQSDTDRLVTAMLRDCWPGGTGDRTETVALEWVRRWGPRRVGPIQSACSCAVGRCRVCN